MRLNLTRDFYAPKNATVIRSKLAEAVAYVYTDHRGNPAAMFFFGKRAKPEWNFRFKNDADRAARVTKAFAWAAQVAAYKTGERAKRTAQTHNFELGHVLKASWGYDQTNVNFYQVTRIVSDKMVEVRPIASMTGKTDTSMSGSVLPALDKFTGETIRRRASRNGIRIDSSRYASVWDGKPAFESSWH